MNYILIFIGGGLGSVARYELGKRITSIAGSGFPAGTISVNVLSCLILGVLFGTLQVKSLNQPWVLFLGTGFCGGFSTFSSFTSETFILLKEGNYFYAGANIVLSVLICLLSLWAGWMISKWFR